MRHPNDIDQMEIELRRVGVSVARLCDDAGIRQTTWWRWKTKANQPHFATWGRVCTAYDNLISDSKAPA